MFDTPEQLLEKIRLGEDSLLECKAVSVPGDKVKAPARDDVADELAAFANAKGGVLVLGVDDKTRQVQGIPEAQLDLVERFAAEICQDALKPPLYAKITRLRLPNAAGEAVPAIRIDVDRSLFVHESPRGYFYRVGSSKRKMAPDYLFRLSQHRSQTRMIRFDELVVPGTKLEDLDVGLVDRFRTPRTTDDLPTLLRKLGMAAEDEEGKLRPTVAGVLLGSAAPEQWLRQAYMQAVAYRGDGPPGVDNLIGYQIDARDITGPLDQQVSEACKFVLRNMRIGASKIMGRVDVPQYDMTAIFEALVNAVAHRDYSVYGSKIRLRLFETRLELFVPGSLSNSMTVDSLSFRQFARNETLTSLLAKCPVPNDIAYLETARTTLMDRRGEGVPQILDRSLKLSGRLPEYVLLDDAELKVTIHAASAAEQTQP